MDRSMPLQMAPCITRSSYTTTQCWPWSRYQSATVQPLKGARYWLAWLSASLLNTMVTSSSTPACSSRSRMRRTSARFLPTHTYTPFTSSFPPLPPLPFPCCMTQMRLSTASVVLPVSLSPSRPIRRPRVRGWKKSRCLKPVDRKWVGEERWVREGVGGEREGRWRVEGDRGGRSSAGRPSGVNMRPWTEGSTGNAGTSPLTWWTREPVRGGGQGEGPSVRHATMTRVCWTAMTRP